VTTFRSEQMGARCRNSRAERRLYPQRHQSRWEVPGWHRSHEWDGEWSLTKRALHGTYVSVELTAGSAD